MANCRERKEERDRDTQGLSRILVSHVEGEFSLIQLGRCDGTDDGCLCIASQRRLQDMGQF